MKNESPDYARGKRRYRAGVVVFALASTAAAILTASCAGLDDPVVLATPETDANPPRTFVPEDAGDGGEGGREALRCIATECPTNFATCASGDWEGRAAFKCQHDLLNDDHNCGACGNECDDHRDFGVVGKCSLGRCHPVCVDGRRDCNNQSDDGCEVDVFVDSKNCGACGNACAEGVPCRNGACGCPTPLTNCGSVCLDLRTDNFNCGACGNICQRPQDAGALPPNTRYTCVDGKCNQIACKDTFQDCNDELPRDGCEVDVERSIGDGKIDPENCGGCGVKCDPGKDCRKLVTGEVVCGCRATETLCKSTGYECVDLETDPKHCGLCNYRCPYLDFFYLHLKATCTKGVCGTECDEGWGDCNNNPGDGCETNLTYDGANCGACGNQCNSALGQPCVGGTCLTRECDAGDPVTR